MKTATKKVSEKKGSLVLTAVVSNGQAEKLNDNAAKPSGADIIENESAEAVPTAAQPGVKAALRAKLGTVISVEALSKWVEDMNYLKAGLSKLKAGEERLRGFEIKVREEPDNTDRNYWTGCTLTIKDDNGQAYEVKNPVVIAACVKFLYETFEERAQEIETEILEKANSYPY
ncbi:hypothetical protein [Chitinophaga sp. MM2321]|uniref:hypothetical protein n=1 Tax=Chitinophaga sp. MM2321 TaxID=3137178 RepID=UPI0032D5786B